MTEKEDQRLKILSQLKPAKTPCERQPESVEKRKYGRRLAPLAAYKA
jgi:hypothetical protein